VTAVSRKPVLIEKVSIEPAGAWNWVSRKAFSRVQDLLFVRRYNIKQ
jgi:hypothetical protein